MDTENIILVLFLLIAIVIPPQKNMGVNGFMKDWDAHIEKPNKKLSPPKLIQIRYGIGKSSINIITYISFLVDFSNWLMCIVMLPCVLVFKDESLNIAILIFAIVYMTINLPIGIVRTICTIKISKKQNLDKRNSIQPEEYVIAYMLAETATRRRSSEYREARQRHKEYVNIIAPFLKEFEKCIDKKNGDVYISDDNLNWAIDKIFPKYQKHLSYNISKEDSSSRLLTISLIRGDKVIKQLQVKSLY